MKLISIAVIIILGMLIYNGVVSVEDIINAGRQVIQVSISGIAYVINLIQNVVS
jgi:hypothetical protein